MIETKVTRKATEGGGELLETDFIAVVFQKGFPAQVGVNGCRTEDVIRIALDRLESYQSGPLACEENERAIKHLRAAIGAMMDRIKRREEQGVLNTMSQHESSRTEDEDEDFSATGA